MKLVKALATALVLGALTAPAMAKTRRRRRPRSIRGAQSRGTSRW